MSAILKALFPNHPRVEYRPTHICMDDSPSMGRPGPNCGAVYSRDESLKLTYGGDTLTVNEWAKRLGVSRTALYKRLDRWPLDRALSTTGAWKK